MALGFSMGCYAYLKFLMHLVLSLNSKSSVFPLKMIMCHNEKIVRSVIGSIFCSLDRVRQYQ